jgi:hypothetical protein
MKKSSMIKSRIVFMAFLAAALLLGMTACPHDDGGNGGGKKPTFPDSAELLSLTLGEEAAHLGEPAATPDAVTETGEVGVYQRNGVAIKYEPLSNGNVSVSWALVASLDGFDPDNGNFIHGASINFEVGKKILIVKSISHDKSETLYYVIHVDVVLVKIKSITVGGQIFNTPAALPKRAASEEWTEPLQINLDSIQPAGGTFDVTISAEADDTIEGEETVEWGRISSRDEIGKTVDFTGEFYQSRTSYQCHDTDHIVFKVEPPEGDDSAAAYYRVIINLKHEATITYRKTVEIAEEKLNAWQGISPLTIRKVFDDAGAEYLLNPTTVGEARLFFNETGLYVYVKVTDPDVTETAATNNYDQADSVEIFINEDYANTKTGGYDSVGGRYRIGANGERSAEPAAALDKFELDEIAVWKTADGYSITAHIPWRFKDEYPMIPGETKLIGIELQINACGDTGGRYATMAWNNNVHTNVGNIASYAKATMSVPTNFIVGAKKPYFSGDKPEDFSNTFTVSQLSDKNQYNQFIAMVWGRPATDDEGALSWQWYQATSATDEGVPVTIVDGTEDNLILGPEGLNLTPGTYYFYIKATNTLTNELGTTTASADSERAVIVIAP